MSEYAPASIQHVYDRLVELRPDRGFTMLGIVGDQDHTYGYHRARAVLPADDYSVVLPADQDGPDWAASALDIGTPDPDAQAHLTRRLLVAARDRDPVVHRLVREFYGSLDGRNTIGWDFHSHRFARSSSDHTTHVHLSFYRRNIGRPQLLTPIADVLAYRPALAHATPDTP